MYPTACPKRTIQFGSNPVRHGARCNAPRLRMPDHACHAAPELEADFRQLRRFARTGLSANDDDLVFLDRACNLVPPRNDRQDFGINWPGQIGQTPCMIDEFFIKHNQSMDIFENLL